MPAPMLIIIQLAALLLLTPMPPAALVVSLHDAHGAPVSGADVQLLDRSGAALLGRATTDATGEARFASVPADEVRVLVQGRLADGTAFRQEGMDARGIAVILDVPPTRLDLRMEQDGHVRPDPATMITPDDGALLDLQATVVPTATVQTVPTVAAPAPAPLVPAPENEGSASWLVVARAVALAALAAMLAATAIALLATRRR